MAGCYAGMPSRGNAPGAAARGAALPMWVGGANGWCEGIGQSAGDVPPLRASCVRIKGDSTRYGRESAMSKLLAGLDDWIVVIATRGR